MNPKPDSFDKRKLNFVISVISKLNKISFLLLFNQSEYFLIVGMWQMQYLFHFETL